MEIRDTRNGEWHWVSNKTLACNSIDVYDKAVYSALSTFAGCAEIRPSFEIIAKRCNVSVRKAKNSIKMLEKFGFITIKNHGKKGVSNVYNLIKSLNGCQKCTACLSKKGTAEQEVVHATTGSSAQRAPQLDKELDKEVDKNFSKEKLMFHPYKENVIDADTGELVEDEKPDQNRVWDRFLAYWKKTCNQKYGFIPEAGGIKDKTIFHRITKKYSSNEKKDIIDFFLKSKKSKDHLTISACFSADTINLWKFKR